ncbi:hypothetical protein DRJ25_05205, partial [Candidatus Woesearchaeota archaeon]
MTPSTGWSYYKQITLSNPQKSYPVRIHLVVGSGTDNPDNNTIYIPSGYCQNFPYDIRFGSTNNPSTAVQLPQWLEYNTTTEAWYWINTTSSNYSTIYLFVGNSGASLYSEPDDVFIYFDDFDNGISAYSNVTDSRRDTHYKSNVVSTTGNIAVRTKTKITTWTVTSTYGSNQHIALADTDTSTIPSNDVAYAILADGDYADNSHLGFANINRVNSNAYRVGTSPTELSFSTDTYYFYEIKYFSDFSSAVMYDTDGFTVKKYKNNSNVPSVTLKHLAFIGYHGDEAGSTYNWSWDDSTHLVWKENRGGNCIVETYIDWVLIRKAVEDETTISSTGAWNSISGNNPPSVTDPSPSDGATDVSVSISELSCNISDPDGDLMNWTIETSPDIGNASGNNAGNGTITCSVSGLQYGTTYHWYVNVTDGEIWSNVTFTFTTEEVAGKKFRIWITTDWHTNISNPNYEGNPVAYDVIEDAIEDSENDWSFDWNISLVLGDVADSGTESQYISAKNVMFNTLTEHNREDIYFIAGNHDYNGGSSARQYFQQYIDPTGEHPSTSGVNNSKRPFQVENVTNYGCDYTIKVGNVLIIMMSPNWDGSDSHEYNYTWWRSIVENTSNDTNIIVCTHHPVENSGITSSNGEYVDGQFDDWMSSHPGRITAWICGHEHYDYNNGETYVNTKWNTTFINACSMNDGATTKTAAKSIVLEFTEGSQTVNVYDYFHGYHGSDFPLSTEQWHGNDQNRGNFTFTLNNASFEYPETPVGQWQWVRQLNISNAEPNYQIRLQLYKNDSSKDDPANGTIDLAGHCENFPYDIRFGNTSDPSTATILPQWIQESNNTCVTIWVKLPSTGYDTIYLFAGNSSAGLYSDGDATFEFFDDFEGTSLNTSKWTNVGSNSLSISDSEITITSQEGDYTEDTGIHSVNTFSISTTEIYVKIKRYGDSLADNDINIGISENTDFSSDNWRASTSPNIWTWLGDTY